MAHAKHLEYIRVKLQTLLNDFTTEALSKFPRNIEEFTLEWLESRNTSSLSAPEEEELRFLRSEIDRLKSGKKSDVESDKSSESSEEPVEELPVKIIPRKTRVSVSAEAYGIWNKKKDFVPRQIPKTNEQRSRISEVLNRCFMFSSLDRLEKEVLILAFEERKFNPNEKVIEQGEDGNELFVIESGEYTCTKTFPNETEPRYLKKYSSGEAFGELALLYNVPRAANITSIGQGVCWVLDRDCFNNIVKEAAQRKREKYEDFLASIDLFKEIDAYERSQMADALQSISYEPGEYIIREGEWGDVFYLVEEGEAIVTKTITPGLPPQEVHQYYTGNYFGELALIKGAPRAANVIARTHIVCAIMDRRAFIRLLGPIEDILKRNASRYEAYIF